MRKILAAAVAAMLALTLLAGAALADPKAYDYWVVAIRSGEVHESPDSDSVVRFTFEEGDEMYYLYEFDWDVNDEIWYHVEGSETGWIRAKDVQLLNIDGVICEGDRFEVDRDATLIRATGGDTNVRDMPNKDAWSLGVLKQGDAAIYAGVRYTDYRDMTWFYVEFEDENGMGRDGWVSYKYTTAE